MQKWTKIRSTKLTSFLSKLTQKSRKLTTSLRWKQWMTSSIWCQHIIKSIQHLMKSRGCISKKFTSTRMTILVLENLTLTSQTHSRWQMLQVVTSTIKKSQTRRIHRYISMRISQSTSHTMTISVWILSQSWICRKQKSRQIKLVTYQLRMNQFMQLKWKIITTLKK